MVAWLHSRGNIYGNLSDDTQANVLLFGAMLMLAAAFDRRRAAPERGLAGVLAAAVAIELLFGKLGAFYRYEAYICGATVMALRLPVSGALLAHRAGSRGTASPRSWS